MVDDAEAAWTHPPESLDYIHIRHMTSSIRDWPKLISQAYEYVTGRRHSSECSNPEYHPPSPEAC